MKSKFTVFKQWAWSFLSVWYENYALKPNGRRVLTEMRRTCLLTPWTRSHLLRRVLCAATVCFSSILFRAQVSPSRCLTSEKWMFQNIPERTLIPLRQKCVLLFFPPYFVSSRACLLCHVETPSTCFSWLLQYTSLPLSRLTIIGYNVFFMCGGLLKMFKCKSITQKAQSRRFPRGASVLKREF